jgi:putative membrane-bound dehydrogenase-like protein
MFLGVCPGQRRAEFVLAPVSSIPYDQLQPTAGAPTFTFPPLGFLMDGLPRRLALLLSITLLPLTGRLWAQGFSPEEAVKRMKVPDGFRVKLVACEPEIRQPVTMSFDDRGRLWVIQYLQYPTPAGLTPVKVDQYLRTVYDRVPEPPPRGPRGADKITILEPGADGRFHKVRDFVTGLNLASGMAIGYGGVFVAQPPYLLFYPDRNGDDVPDGDPEVLLTGFGMQDAHAFPNSLQWGPDGWLYGAQGSTVTANIRGISFQQGIWRYHPRTREFELFAEGGGNTWGVDFDRHGNILAGTNYGDSVLLHQVQGAYYIKGFAKHGELHNPNAFGYFGHVPYQGFKGGHVTCGGIIYHGGSFPQSFEDTYIACNPLANAIYWHTLKPAGSSFTARFGGDLVIGNDTWFRPVDLEIGPDGSLFVADWYDKRINHVDPVDNWDRSNGRIYKIEANGVQPPAGLPLGCLSSRELIGLLAHRNEWYSRQARRLLGERRDPASVPILRQMVLESTGDLALESLWALYVSGGFDDAIALRLLDHINPDVRAWTIRLLGDARQVSQPIRERQVALARNEPSCMVRNQLACSCKRLPGKDALPIVHELLQHQEDLRDPQIPLLLWWTIESKAVSDRRAVLHLLDGAQAWNNPLIRQAIVERLSRRYMAEGGNENLESCARLLELAPDAAGADRVVAGMEKALEGRRLEAIPPRLATALRKLADKEAGNLQLVRLGLRLNDAQAYKSARQIIRDGKAPASERTALIRILGELGQPDAVPALTAIFRQDPSAEIRSAALTALERFSDPDIANTVLRLYPQLSPALRSRAQNLLCSRPASVPAFLQAVDAGKIDAREVPLDQVRRILLLHDDHLNRLVEKHWGRVGPAPGGAKRARIASVKHMLATGHGDPANGKKLFQQKCAICHTLFGEGNKVGPELTGTDRRDMDFLVTSIVDPSAVIRNEYVAYIVATRDGRLLTGLIPDSTPKTITLLDAKNERTVLARDDVESVHPSPQSLMPENALDDLDEQQIRDLLSYVQSNSAPAQSHAQVAHFQPTSQPIDRLASSQKNGRTLNVCLVSGALEYNSDESLAALQKYLEQHYNVKCSRAFRKADDDLPGLENLETCDVMLLFTRRLTIRGEQLERIKKYCQSGKPIVAVRTASHAFQNWLALDHEVLGGNYQNHYGAGPPTQVHIVTAAASHPILASVKPFESPGSLYRNSGLAKDVHVLLEGTSAGHTEPVAWTRLHNGGRVFYTSLGHPDDFKNENFLRLLTNALFWTSGTERKSNE